MKLGKLAFWRKKPKTPKLSNLFPALIKGGKDVVFRDVVTIGATIYGLLGSAWSWLTGGTIYGVGVGGGMVVGVSSNTLTVLSLAATVYSTVASFTTKKKQPLSLQNNGVQVNGRLPTDAVRILYGVARTGTTWGYWTTTSDDVLLKNESLHIVVSCCEGICEIVKDYEQPFWTGWGQGGLVTGGVYTGSSRIATVSVNAAGSGYSANDVLTVVQAGASGGTFIVATVDGSGGVLTVTKSQGGTGYSVANALATTVVPSGGSGCKLNILTLEGFNKYKIQIDGTTPDTFKWSDTGGTVWNVSAVAITGEWQNLNNGMKIKFKKTTGYTLGSYWTFYAGDGIWLGDRLIYYYQDIFGRSFADYYFHSGAADQTVDANLVTAIPEYTNAHRYTCYAYFKLKASFSNDTSVWKGVPEIKLTLRKIDIYDTRTSTTGFSDNPALIYRDYYINTRYGGGKASTYLDTTSVNDAANWCEANSFTFNGVFVDRQEHRDNLEEIMLNARLYRVDSGGVEKLKIYANDAAVMTFAELEAEVDINPESFSISQQGIPETYNRVVCGYYDRAKGYAYCEQKYEDLDQIASDGDVRELRLELIGTNNGTQAKKIAKYHQLRSKYSEKYSLFLHPKCYALEPGDMITATHAFPGWTATKTRIESIGIIQSGMVPIVTVKESSAIYDQTVDIDTTDEPWSNYVNPPVITPSKVTGVVLQNAGVYIDSQTGTTMAKILVEWTNSADGEGVVDYEILIQEKQTDVAVPASIVLEHQGAGHDSAGHVGFGHGGAMQVNWSKQ